MVVLGRGEHFMADTGPVGLLFCRGLDSQGASILQQPLGIMSLHKEFDFWLRSLFLLEKLNDIITTRTNKKKN